MKSLQDFCSYHTDMSYEQIQEVDEIKRSPVPLTMIEVAAQASPEFYIWIATSIGVAPPEHIRMFALWCATQLNSFATDPACKRAITTCEAYFNAPCPELLKNNIDLIYTSPEVIKSSIDDYDVAGSEIRAIFNIADNGYKRWRRETETDDKVAACVHSAILTMSEAHCRELGFNRMNRKFGPRESTPAMAESDNLTIGMHINARMAAYYSAEALGLASADAFDANPTSDQYDEYDERETIAEAAMLTARRAQADWIKQNITLRFD